MRLFGQGLGEDVSKIVGRRNLAETEMAAGELLANKEVTSLNVLGASVKDRLLGKVDGGGIVTVEDRSGGGTPELRKKVREPASLLRSHGGSVQLSLGRGESDGGGAGGAPADGSRAQGEAIALSATAVWLTISPR